MVAGWQQRFWLRVKLVHFSTAEMDQFLTASVNLQQGAEEQDTLASTDALERFWRFRIGALQHEVFQVAFLNSAYRLLRDGIQQLSSGVADRAIVYPRVVMEAALSKRAAAIVLAHNHTNGRVEPSEQDKALTRMIVLAGETLQVRVVDHLGRYGRRCLQLPEGRPVVIAPELQREYPNLDDSKRDVIGTTEGPVLVVAGPGSGKTFSLVLRTLNILLLEKAQPTEIILCTFTEKAAFELRDRVSVVAAKIGCVKDSAKIGCVKDLSNLRVGTIHGVCSQLLAEHRHRTPLGNNYETLDELTQLLFIFERFGQIIGNGEEGLFLGKWKTKWTAIEGVRPYFDKITEEVVDALELTASENPFLQQLGKAYGAIGYYHPDWVVVQNTPEGEVNWIIETKGRVYEGTELKDEAIRLWCERITERTKQQWRFARIDQSAFEAQKPATLAGAVSETKAQAELV